MAHVSNIVFAVLNCISLLIGLTAIALSLYSYIHGGTACQRALQNPLLMMGIFFSLVSLLGLIGSFCRANILMWIYLFVMVLFIIGLMAFTIFAFYVTNQEAGMMVTAKMIHSRADVRHWLQKNFIYGKNWYQIKSCLVDAQVCKSHEDFYKRKLFNIQAGCCKPPRHCGLKNKNETYWTVPKSGPAEPDSDCTTWSNHQETLCFNCNSCKRGVLANIRKEWISLAIFNICILIFNIIILFTGCFSRINNQSQLKSQLKYSRYANVS